MSDVTLTIQPPNVSLHIECFSVPYSAGGGGGSEIVIYQAGETLSAGRCVIIDGGDAFYFQPSDPTHAGRFFGITTGSASMGSNVAIQIAGIVTDAAFTFGADTMLWIGADGEVLDTIPASGEIFQKAGISLGGNDMKIDTSIQLISIV